MISKPIDGAAVPTLPDKPIDGAAAPAAPTAPSAPEGFAEAHRDLLADRSIQFDLPRFQPPEPPAWLRWLTEFLSGDHPVLNVLLWTLIAAAAGLILYFIVRRLAGSRWPLRRRGDAAEEAEWRPDQAPARALLQEADALAAQGRFAEAVHLLLFRSIEDIDSRRPDLVRPALTSRDIAALDAIPGRPRGAFARIAMLVERGLFARRPLAEADWRDCRSAYEEFAFAEGWRG
jgi:hypothetical protein